MAWVPAARIKFLIFFKFIAKNVGTNLITAGRMGKSTGSLDKGLFMMNRPIHGGAVLYTVCGPRGSYYAVHNPGSGRLFPEAVRHAARAQAQRTAVPVMAEETLARQKRLPGTGGGAGTATQAQTN